MFTQYTMDQLFLPMDLEEDIPHNHVVRVINDAVNRIDDKIFESAYPGGGRHSYHPKLMTKIIIYAYSQRIYSSRHIAKAVRENIPFMWLAARQRPDFRTINRFRSERLKDVLEKVFTAVLELLADDLPRRMKVIVEALAERHSKDEVERTVMRLFVTGAVIDGGKGYSLPPATPDQDED